jgi:hypothetical protein
MQALVKARYFESAQKLAETERLAMALESRLQRFDKRVARRSRSNIRTR